MKQMSFADAEYAGKRKQTRRELFLIEMNQVVRWKGPIGLIEPHSPKGEGGPPAFIDGHVADLSDADTGSATATRRWKSPSTKPRFCRFAGLHLDRILDETTILNFRPRCKNMSWPLGFCRSSTAIWATEVCCYAKVLWLMRRLLMRPVRPRTR